MCPNSDEREGSQARQGLEPYVSFFLFSTFFKLIELFFTISYAYKTITSYTTQLRHRCAPTATNATHTQKKGTKERHVFLLVSVFFYFFSFFYIYYLVYVDYIVRRRRNNVTALPCRRCVNTPHPRLKRESLG